MTKRAYRMEQTRRPRRGELESAGSKVEVGNIWRTRDEEPTDEEPVFMRCHYEADREQEEIEDYGRRLWAVAEHTLSPMRLYILVSLHIHGASPTEIARERGISVARVYQLAKDAYRRLNYIIHRNVNYLSLGPPPRMTRRQSRARHPGFAWEEPLS